MKEDLRIRKKRVLVFWETGLEKETAVLAVVQGNIKVIENTIEAVKGAETIEELTRVQRITLDDGDFSRRVSDKIRLLVALRPEASFDEVINDVRAFLALKDMWLEEFIDKFPHAKEDYLKAREEFGSEDEA